MTRVAWAGLLAGLLLALPSPAGAASRLDEKSAHTAIKAWQRYAGTVSSQLPVAQHDLASFTDQVVNGCGQVLAAMNALPADQLNWRAVDAALTEAGADVLAVSARVVEPAFERFASKVAKLRWSSRGARSAVRRSLELQRRFLLLQPSDLCANARALADDLATVPVATLQFVRTANSYSAAAGMRGLARTLSRVVSRDDAPLLDALAIQLRDLGNDVGILVGSNSDELLKALGITHPFEIISVDFDAQSDAVQLASLLELCFSATRDYGKCNAPKGTGMSIGSAPGQVEVTSTTRKTYTVVAHSKSGTDFRVEKLASGDVTSTCNRPEVAACDSSGRW